MRTVQTCPSDGRFVVGVDFGTTFTCVAFAHSVSPDTVKLVQTWSHGPSSGDSADQVPTELNYKAVRWNLREYEWGYQIPPPSKTQPDPLKWFKLLLQTKPRGESSEPQTDDPLISKLITGFASALNLEVESTPATRTRARLEELEIDPVTVVEDFLLSVRETTLNSISTTYDKEFVKASKMQYIITVPAIWSDAAKAKMVQACERAGYGKHRRDFFLVSEPEAAAAHTLKAIQPHDLKENDTFIICDAGGGTVDLISYKIRSMDPLVIDEVVSGSGDLCGAVYLDDNFSKYIEDRLGKQVIDTMSSRARATMEQSWRDQVKYKFSSTQDMLFEVTVPGVPDDEDLGIEEGFHTIARASVEEIFDPIVDRVIKLVDEQVEAVERMNHQVTAILLVGGFGSSKYLFERLQASKFGYRAKEIEVIQPMNAKTAIARGALLRGIDGSYVEEKRWPLSYGVAGNGRLSRYPLGRMWAYYDEVEGHHKVSDCMFWYLKKNEAFKDKESVSMEFSRKTLVLNPKLVFKTIVWGTNRDTAPRFRKGSGGAVFKVGEIVSNLTSVPKQTLTRFIGRNGLEYYRVKFMIKMSNDANVLKAELIHGGKSYGETEINYIDD